jgi:hypothetical protein
MNKLKPEALWNRLSVGQRETLDRWLFEENLSCVEALPRAQKEMGFTGQLSSLKRYYQRRRQEWVMEELAEMKGSPEGEKGARLRRGRSNRAAKCGESAARCG